MKLWEKQKRWSDRFLPQIKRELGEFLIAEPEVEEDEQRNTDLAVLKLEAVRIGCRVRKYDFYLRYPDEFTVRCALESGVKTELAKIIEGWGDFMFYGFCDQSEQRLIAWRIICLKAFRLWFNRSIVAGKGKMPGFQKLNADGQSSFIAFDAKRIPDAVKIEVGFNNQMQQEFELQH